MTSPVHSISSFTNLRFIDGVDVAESSVLNSENTLWCETIDSQEMFYNTYSFEATKTRSCLFHSDKFNLSFVPQNKIHYFVRIDDTAFFIMEKAKMKLHSQFLRNLVIMHSKNADIRRVHDHLVPMRDFECMIT